MRVIVSRKDAKSAKKIIDSLMLSGFASLRAKIPTFAHLF